MSEVSTGELNRQYRVLNQTLSMHSMLGDRYARRALLLDVILLACSVIFCATTFARDSVLTLVGVSAYSARTLLGIASVTAFFASLVALRVDWKGKTARHRDAVQKLTHAMELFRRLRTDDGAWPLERGDELNRAYWDAINNVVEVPSSLFVSLKARHVRKVQLSKMLDSAPGSPVLVLRLILLGRAVKKAWRAKAPRE